ncbi:MAG: cadherin-like beta sandwich domain-containing protein, partial [bacterium]|nr:cadherin-like beta sandwich domain-containing protein [bacterium]
DTNYSDSYTIMIQREKDTNANLATLAVSEGMLTPVFSANIDDYTVEVGSEITSLEITATADDPKATISGDRGVQNLQFGDNPFTITVTAEDQVTTKNYTVTVKRAKKNDATLRDLTVDGVTVTGFDPLQDRYEMEVANNISAITILATANDNNATIRQNTLGIKPLVVGDNVFTINVTAHDGTTTKTYHLTIHRKASSDHSITSLMVFGKAALWNGQDGKYEVEVDYAIQQLTPDDIVAILPQGATIDKGTGMNLVTGANTYTISVRAEDGTKKSYTMEITRNLSNDSSLRDLTIYGQTPTFNDVDKQYELEVENTVTTLTPDDISATVSAGATLNKGMGANLIVGQNNYSIMVTAGNGNVETYRIVITRKAPLLSTDSSLVSLEVTGYPLTPSFKQTTLSYSIGNIGYDVNELTVVATTSDTKSSIRYYVNDTLQTSNVISLPNQEGAATIKVEIMAEDTTTTEYIINYVKKSNISYQITSNVHTIIGDNIQTVKLDTTGIEIKNQLDNPSEYLEIWTADEARKVEDGEKLATGMIVKLMIDGIERDRKYIVIKGDADGDGLIDLLDAVKILNHYLSRTMLTGPYYEAAQVMEDADIDLLDSVMILNHYLGRSLLH